MSHGSRIIIRCLLLIVGLGLLIFLLAEPHHEGRNIDVDFWKVYTNDPFLWYAYLVSLLPFTILYQMWCLTGFTGSDTDSLTAQMRASTLIMICAMMLFVLILLPVVSLLIVRPEDDIAGGVAMGVITCSITAVTALSAKRHIRRIQSLLQSGGLLSRNSA